MFPDDTEKNVRFAELLCARLCHDLAGPVGAVMAGAEFLADAGGDAEEIELLQSSAVAISARLKYLRAVFGPPQRNMKVRALCDLAHAFLQSSSGYELAWESAVDDEEILPGEIGRGILLLVFLARDCLPRGGRIRVSEKKVTPLCLSVRAEGNWSEAVLNEVVLSEGDDMVLSAKTAPVSLLRGLARSMGGELSVETSSECLALTVR